MKKPVPVISTIKKVVRKARAKSSGKSTLIKLKNKNIAKKRLTHQITVVSKAKAKAKKKVKPFYTVAFKKRRTYK